MNSLIRSLSFSMLILAAVGCTNEPKLNVILISLDTLRADHLTSYGYDRPTSPFLDQLADRGALFENAYVQLPGTLPSHMSIFTGLYPNEHGVFPPNGALASEILTLPEILHRAGYKTAGFTEGGYVAGHFGFDRGFDRFDDNVPKLTNDIEVVFSRGLEFIQKHQGNEPFFLFLHTYAVHDPYFPPLPYTQRYLDGMNIPEELEGQFDLYSYKEMPLMTPNREAEHRRIYQATRDVVTANLPPGADLPTGPLLAAKNRGNSSEPSPATLTYYTSLYDASINYVDDVLRAFFGSLETSGILDNTVIIVTSDHGEEFLEHGKLTHEQVYQECLHVPLIVLAPGVQRGLRVPDIVRSIDLAPTIYQLTGVVPSAPTSGVSLVPLLERTGLWNAQDAFARDTANIGRSLHSFDQRLLQTVVHQSAQQNQSRWHSRTAKFTTNQTKIEFRAMSYHTAREVNVTIDGSLHSKLEMTPEWQDFTIELDGKTVGRSFIFSSQGCEVPQEVAGSNDQRCLSFRIANFPVDNIELFDLTSDPSGTIDMITQEPNLGKSLAQSMEHYGVNPIIDSETVTLSPEDIERLKSLGYLQ